jgi:hypothetical protein
LTGKKETWMSQAVSTTDLARVAERLAASLGLEAHLVGFEMCPNGGLPTFYVDSRSPEIRLPLVQRAPKGAVPITEVPRVIQRMRLALQVGEVRATKERLYLVANGVLGGACLVVPRHAIRPLGSAVFP